MKTNENAEPLDLVWGIEAIGRVIGRTVAQTHYLLRTGAIPARKVGEERWVASRQKLIDFFMGDAA